ncbi:MAG: vanadium-dependent haloperoxidase [Bacteroidia bacterium]
MKVISQFLFVLISMQILYGCKSSVKQKTFDAGIIRQCNKKLTDVIVVDIFTPPVAARMYAYSNIAAFEVLVNEYSNYKSLAGQVKDLKDIPKPEKNLSYDFSLASAIAFSTVARKTVYSEFEFSDFEKHLLDSAKIIGTDEKVILNSQQYGEQVGQAILKWMMKDNFAASRKNTRYALLNKPGSWIPTPPDYMDAIEPYWNTIRTFVIDSPSLFLAPRPYEFDTITSTDFYKMAKTVYDTTNMLTGEQKQIALYWDDNPFVSETAGHLKFFNKKTTPTGHWMNIVSLSSKIKNLNIMETSELYTLTAMAMHDGFVACWDEKYRSNLIRPVSYINLYIDRSWKTFLQTPPFPEYTSGHSTISATAAQVLTLLIGDTVSFTDSSQVEYGFPVRSFKTFHDASAECSISRVYGGIHYMPACTEGRIMGKKIGEYVVRKIQTKVK